MNHHYTTKDYQIYPKILTKTNKQTNKRKKQNITNKIEKRRTTNKKREPKETQGNQVKFITN